MSEKRISRTDSISSLERRRFIRILERCPLTFVSKKGNGEGELIDLSLRGMRFVSDSDLAVGGKIRSIFTLSNGISLDLTGIIRHRQGKTRKWIYGVTFSIQDYCDLKEHLKLNDYILQARVKQDCILQKELLRRKGL